MRSQTVLGVARRAVCLVCPCLVPLVCVSVFGSVFFLFRFFFCVFLGSFGGVPPSGTTFSGQRVPADPPGGPETVFWRFLVNFGLRFGGPGRSFFGLFGDFFLVFFGYGSGDAFRRILGRFWEVFRCYLGAFLEIPGFCDFTAPAMPNHRFLG